MGGEKQGKWLTRPPTEWQVIRSPGGTFELIANSDEGKPGRVGGTGARSMTHESLLAAERVLREAMAERANAELQMASLEVAKARDRIKGAEQNEVLAQSGPHSYQADLALSPRQLEEDSVRHSLLDVHSRREGRQVDAQGEEPPPVIARLKLPVTTSLIAVVLAAVFAALLATFLVGGTNATDSHGHHVPAAGRPERRANTASPAASGLDSLCHTALDNPEASTTLRIYCKVQQQQMPRHLMQDRRAVLDSMKTSKDYLERFLRDARSQAAAPASLHRRLRQGAGKNPQ